MGTHGLFQVAIDPILRQAQNAGVKFGHIILAAPDVDARTFSNDLRYVRDMSEQITIYVSRKDKALSLSQAFASWPVAGLKIPPIVVPGVDTVDVSETDLTFLGHSYVASDTAVLRDMLQVIVQSKRADERKTLQRTGTYWQLLKE